MPHEMISGTFGLFSPSRTLSHTLNADSVVKDLHSDYTETILPTVSEVKIVVCKLCKMTFIPSPAITGSVSATHFGNVVDFQYYYGDTFLFVFSRSGEP